MIGKVKGLLNRIQLRKILKPQIACEEIICCGNTYGGFDVATKDLNFVNQQRKLVIYSFGIGEDLSFSEAVYSKWKCDIFAFDPTPKSKEYVKNHELNKVSEFHFYEWGLSDSNKIGEFHLPQNDNYVSGSLVAYDGVKEETIAVELKTLDSIMQQLGHETIDLLKMDIEGSEFAVIDNILTSGVRFNQLCVEIHNRFFNDGIARLKRMISQLNDNGYYIASVSDGLEEITFIKVAGMQ